MQLKTRIKDLAGRGLLAARLHRRLMSRHGLVVAFHRIDDRYPGDGISYGTAGFRRMCRLFAEHFDVVSLSSFLDDVEAGRSIAGKVVVTFDDGYLDNYTAAAPILAEHGLPATFFITTGFVGSSTIPWWDREAGIRSEWMSWDQVAELDRLGHEIGAHTVNHVDLGEVVGDAARREIVASRDEIQDRLGTRVDLFAYPYGREHQMTDRNREILREEGFRCCVSCFGGRVPPGEDPFRMKREPISPWYEGTGQFVFDVVRQ